MFENICNNCLNNRSYIQNTKFNMKKKNISIINAVLTNETIISPDNAIPFNAKRVYISDDIVQQNNTDFIISAGLYKVTFTTNTKLNIGESNNNISLGVTINGFLIPGSIIKKSCGPNEKINLSTQLVFCVANGTTAILNITNVKEDTSIIICDNANIIIERLL